MAYNMYIVEVFGEEKFTGKTVAVILNDGYLPEDIMQKVSRELKIDRTVFVNKDDTDEFSLKFFSTKSEIDNCIIGNVAAFYSLTKSGYVRPIESGTKKIISRCGKGRERIYIEYDNYEAMTVELELTTAVSDSNKYEDNEALSSIYDNSKGIVIQLEDCDCNCSMGMILFGDKEVFDSIEPNDDIENIVNKDFNISMLHLLYVEPNNVIHEKSNLFNDSDINKGFTRHYINTMLYYLRKNDLINYGDIVLKLHLENGEILSLKFQYSGDSETETVRIVGNAHTLVDGVLRIND